VDGIQSPEAESSEDRSAVVCDLPMPTSTQQELAGVWRGHISAFINRDLGIILDSEMSFRRTSTNYSVVVFTSSDVSRAALKHSQRMLQER